MLFGFVQAYAQVPQVHSLGGGALSIESRIEFDYRTAAQERLTVLGVDLFGDEIDPHTGTIAFKHTDISIPGNNRLPVELTRTLRQGPEYKHDNAEFGDWTVSVPSLKVVSSIDEPWQGNICTASFDDQFDTVWVSDSVTAATVANFVYNNGIMFYWDGDVEPLLERNFKQAWPTNAKYVTNSLWYFTCHNNQNKEYFIGHSPEGFQVRFDKVIQRNAMDLNIMYIWDIHRNTYILAVTEITDSHGNWVKYDYDAQGRLERIFSNDGRSIDLAYESGSNLIASATANGRVWHYTYRSSTSGGMWSPPGGQVLETVELPDGRQWLFSLDGMKDRAPHRYHCLGAHQLEMTHPSGASAEFDMLVTSHRTEFDHRVQLPFYYCPTGQYGNLVSLVAVNTWSVVRKAISGPGIDTAEWTFIYEQDRAAGENAGDMTNWTKIDGPSEHVTYYHNWLSRPAGGAEVVREIRASDGGPILRKITTDYDTESQHGLPLSRDPYVGHIGYSRAPRRVAEVEVLQGGETYTSVYAYGLDADASNYSFGNPVSQSASSTLGGGTRTTSTTYEHNTTNWILGLPLVQTVNGKPLVQLTFDANGNITQYRRTGETKATLGYNAQGLLSSYQDAVGRQTLITGYHRGVPTSLTRPDGVSVTRTVDDNGWVTSQTDGNGVTTGFSHNSMGWLTGIDRVSPWSDTAISYSGLGAGVVQTSTRGDMRTVTTYDRYHRPVMTEQIDLTGAASSVYNTFQYDGLGRTVFASLPSFAPSGAPGVATTYDALGRVLTSTMTADSAVTTYAYGPNNSVTVTDPENNATTTLSSGFAGPDDGNPLTILQPEGVTTTMTYDIWGNLLTATQGGFTQSWAYDSQLRLCRHRTPESYGDLFAYNAADELIAMEEGASATSCGSITSANAINYTYDDMGRVTLIDYPAGTPDVAMSYDNNGNMLTNHRGGAQWSYTYNSANQPTAEVLSIDGRTYSVINYFNSDGHLFRRFLPSLSVDYDLDGFGRQTQAAWDYGNVVYATGAQYTADGQIEGFTYGNGKTFAAQFNARQEMTRQTVAGTGGTIIDLSYNRDANGRITDVFDTLATGQNRDFTYDGLGRLINADGPWGAGSFVYMTARAIFLKRISAPGASRWITTIRTDWCSSATPVKAIAGSR